MAITIISGLSVRYGGGLGLLGEGVTAARHRVLGFFLLS